MASTNMIGDMQTVINNGPQGLTTSYAIRAQGPIMDYPGNCKIVKQKLQEAEVLLGSGTPTASPVGIIGDTDPSGDSANLASLNSVVSALTGGGGPSATAITTMKLVISNGPQGNTSSYAIRAQGPIMDYPGNCKIVLEKLQEASVLLGSGSPSSSPVGIIGDTDTSGDSTNLALLAGVSTTLS